MNKDNKKLKFLIILACVIALVITIFLFIPIIKYLNNEEALENYIKSFGFFMPFVYILLVLIQIFIPVIPGEPFEILAGYLFGAFWGSIIAIFAESLASILIILLVRKYGIKLIRVLFKDKDIEKVKFLNNKKLFFLFVILFIIPGTPKDLLCYVSGIMNFDLTPLILVTTFGRIPAIITSTIPGSALGNQNYKLAIIVYSITIVISIIGIIIYNKCTKKDK